MKIPPNLTSLSIRTPNNTSTRRTPPADGAAAFVSKMNLSQAEHPVSNNTGNIAPGGATARQVMSRYDLRNITYTDLVKMAGELRDAGALKESDYLDFIGPSPEFASIDGQRATDWNKAGDYVGMHEQRLSFMQATRSEQRFIEFEKHILSLFRHFESLQARHQTG
jgi:hypothetical protein